MSKIERLLELTEQTGNEMAAGLIDDSIDPELVEMSDLISELFTPSNDDDVVRVRDELTLERLKVAYAAIGAALKSMPNDKASAFGPHDVGLLDRAEAVIKLLLTTEQQIGQAHR